MDDAQDQSPADGSPSTHGPDGRGPRGRFGKGNRLGKGNPLAGRAARIRAILLKKLTPAVAGKIADALIKNASAGDLASVRELLDRTIGKPAQLELLERIEALEAQFKEKNDVPRDED